MVEDILNYVFRDQHGKQPLQIAFQMTRMDILMDVASLSLVQTLHTSPADFQNDFADLVRPIPYNSTAVRDILKDLGPRDEHVLDKDYFPYLRFKGKITENNDQTCVFNNELATVTLTKVFSFPEFGYLIISKN